MITATTVARRDINRFDGRTPLVELARRAGLLLGACLLGAPLFAQASDFCMPGQAGAPACPCNNAPTATNKGCGNFGPGLVGQSAFLTALGNASVTNGSDTLQFQAAGENNTVLTIFRQADASGTPAPYGAGIGCLPSTALTLYHGNAGTGEPPGQITRPQLGVDPEVHQRSAALGDTIAAGTLRFYQATYRDKKAAEAANCNDPTATFNNTQGIIIIWGP